MCGEATFNGAPHALPRNSTFSSLHSTQRPRFAHTSYPHPRAQDPRTSRSPCLSHAATRGVHLWFCVCCSLVVCLFLSANARVRAHGRGDRDGGCWRGVAWGGGGNGIEKLGRKEKCVGTEGGDCRENIGLAQAPSGALLCFCEPWETGVGLPMKDPCVCFLLGLYHADVDVDVHMNVPIQVHVSLFC